MNQLTIYSKANCPACVSAKTFLSNYDIPYKEIRIDEDSAAKAFILGRGFRTIPQIFLGDKLFCEAGLLGLKKMTESEIKAILYGTEGSKIV